MQVRAFQEVDALRWDEFCADGFASTFLHTRQFLSYHGARFKDVSLLIEGEENKLVGLFPAAVDPKDHSSIVSHPGITFGGLIHSGALRGERAIDALTLIKARYAEQGFEKLRYKAVPYIYHLVPSSDDLYALFRIGAGRYRCDLSCVIDLSKRLPASERRRRGLKKATKNGVEIHEDTRYVRLLWKVLKENLNRRHNVSPVHSEDEILKLYSLFPSNIAFIVACLDSEVVAGVVLFISSRVVHAQYIASSLVGYEVSALDAVFAHSIQKAENLGARYFDFGISNEGETLNSGLYKFKSEFGGGGVVHDFFEMHLKP